MNKKNLLESLDSAFPDDFFEKRLLLKYIFLNFTNSWPNSLQGLATKFLISVVPLWNE